MIRARIRMLALTVAVCVCVGAPRLAAAEPTIKQLMGENFSGLQSILYALISANYAAVPSQADVIREHASDLQDMIPDTAKNERDKFLAFASNLGAHAQDMKSIAQALMEHDQARSGPGVDHLREALASHYGGMVTMCVACHNRFRPLPVRPLPVE